MKPALIRLSKKILIDKNVENPDLKSIWSTAHQVSMAKLRSRNLSKWDKDHPNISLGQELNGVIGRVFKDNILNGIIPGVTDLSGKINFSFDPTNGVIPNVIYCDYNDEKLFQMEVEFISEPLTLLGHANSYLMMTKGNKIEDLTSEQGIDIVFFFKIESDVLIKNYKTLND